MLYSACSELVGCTRLFRTNKFGLYLLLLHTATIIATKEIPEIVLHNLWMVYIRKQMSLLRNQAHKTCLVDETRGRTQIHQYLIEGQKEIFYWIFPSILQIVRSSKHMPRIYVYFEWQPKTTWTSFLDQSLFRSARLILNLFTFLLYKVS